MAGNHGAAMDWQHPLLMTANPLGINDTHSAVPFWNAVQQDHYDLQGMAKAPPAIPAPYQNLAPSTTAKRKPKATTMPVAKWEPYKMRIKELYVDKQKTMKEVRMIVNEEFALKATERQYKVQITNWKLERNVKKHDRKAIVKKVCHRKQSMGKETGLIKVRGHRINAERLERWMREMGIQMAYTPSELSFYTTSHPESPLLLSPSPSSGLVDSLGPLDHGVESPALIPNLCRYAHMSDPSLFDQNDAHTLLQSLKVILNYLSSKSSSNNVLWSGRSGFYWDQIVATGCRHLNSLIESAPKSTDGNLNILIAPVLRYTLATAPRKSLTTYTSVVRAAFRLTPHGRIHASFFFAPRNLDGFTIGSSDDRTADELVAAKVAIMPSRVVSPFRIEFEFEILNFYSSQCLNTIKVSYQAIVPENSKVLYTAKHGTVEELKETLMNGASLNDHDPNGRSLLSYSLEGPNLEMCKFLLGEGADPNAYEPSRLGSIMQVHRVLFLTHLNNKRASIQSDTAKLLLETGADLSLLDSAGFSIFYTHISGTARLTLETMLNLGDPLISSTALIDHNRQESAIMDIIGQLGHTCCRDQAEKIIVLIKHGVDVSFRDRNGCTALHRLLYWSHYICGDQDYSRPKEYYICILRIVIDIALVLITAGSDVYAVTYSGQTHEQIANMHGLRKIWIKALQFCGYDSGFVLAHPQGVQRSPAEASLEPTIMTLEEYCKLRTEHGITLQEWASEMEVDALTGKGLVDEIVDEMNFDETDVEETAKMTGSTMKFENNTLDSELNWSLVDSVVDIGGTELTGGYNATEEGGIAMDFGENQQSLDWEMQWQNWL